MIDIESEVDMNLQALLENKFFGQKSFSNEELDFLHDSLKPSLSLADYHMTEIILFENGRIAELSVNYKTSFNNMYNRPVDKGGSEDTFCEACDSYTCCMD